MAKLTKEELRKKYTTKIDIIQEYKQEDKKELSTYFKKYLTVEENGKYNRQTKVLMTLERMTDNSEKINLLSWWTEYAKNLRESNVLDELLGDL